MPIGDVFSMTSWTHVAPNARIGFRCTSRKEVAVMMLLGHEAKDGTAPLNLEAAMNQLGWVRAALIHYEGEP